MLPKTHFTNKNFYIRLFSKYNRKTISFNGGKMIQQPMTYVPAPAAEYNAIKINISGANVDAPHAAAPLPPAPPVQPAAPITVPAPAEAGKNINYNA